LSERSLVSYEAFIHIKGMDVTKGWNVPCRRMGR
jgi:hypothetical protein